MPAKEMALTKTILFNNDVLQIRHVACNPPERGCSDVEESPRDVIVLPVRGSFIKHLLDGKQIIAEPSQALFFTAGRPYRISHSIAERDECLAVEFSSETWKEVLQKTLASETMLHLESHCLLPSRAMAERSLLWKKLVFGVTDEIEVAETTFSIVISALRKLPKQRARKRPASHSRRSQQIETVKLALLNKPDKKWTLAALANTVSMSPYHLTRIFQWEEGCPLHQYHLRVRIAGALDALLDTNTDLTHIALEYGFSSHSHFTSAFQNMIGMTPVEFRRSANSAIKKETRKNLIAS